MFTASTLGLALSFLLALLGGKTIAAWIAGRVYGFSRAETGLTLSISVAQAAATLASTIIGFEIGLYGENVVNAVMVVIAISLILTALGAERFASRIERPESEDRRLGESVLVPVNEEMPLARVLSAADRVATASGGVLVPLVVAVPGAEGATVDQTRGELAEIDRTARRLGLTSDAQLRVDRSVSAGISAAVLERNASLILMGWPGPRDARSVLLGATYEEITASADAPTRVPIALAALRSDTFQRVKLAIGEGDLESSRREDVRLALELASALADGDSPLMIGPIEPAALAEIDLEVPAGASHLAGPSDPNEWADELAGRDDLLVLPAHGRPFSTFEDDLSRREASVVVVTSTVAGQAQTSNRAVGIPSPKSSPLSSGGRVAPAGS